MRDRLMIATSLAIGVVGGWLAASGGFLELLSAQQTPPRTTGGTASESPTTAVAQAARPGIIHDSEYYILDAQHSDRWAAEDKDFDRKLAELRKKHGAPPNIIHVLWDDTHLGEVGIPAIQKVRGFETPNINRFAAEGINFMRMYSEPSCTQSRAALITGRLPVRNGMTRVGMPYEYGGLPSSEVTIADVLSKAGYATAMFGKWHLGDIDSSYATRRGFDEALWMPYNQALSVMTRQGQATALAPGSLYPEVHPKDPYDLDPGWRPRGLVLALEGAKGGPVREFASPPTTENYLKMEQEFEKRTLAFVQKNAAARKPFYIAYWPALLGFFPDPEKKSVAGGKLQEALVRIDSRIGNLMSQLKRLGISENTLVIIGSDNGGMTHHGPTGMVETLYRGGKGDSTEGAVRVPAMAVWPGVIAPGQTVGDILHFTDLFTTFARIGNATRFIPTDRIIDGIDQTALLMNGDGFSRRDYIFTYTGTRLAATVKGRFKRSWAADVPGLPSNNTFDLYNDPREANGILIEGLATSGMFLAMRARHELWMEKYPNTPEERAMPLTGIENARPETKAAGQLRMNPAQLPFDPQEFIRKFEGFEGASLKGPE